MYFKKESIIINNDIFVISKTMPVDFNQMIKFLEKDFGTRDYDFFLKNKNITNFFLYNQKQELVSFISINKSFDFNEILLFNVEETYRNVGVAYQFISFILNNNDLENKILLEVRSNNLAAINLYKKVGFKLIGKRKNYYSNPTDDALIMEVKK